MVDEIREIGRDHLPAQSEPLGPKPSTGTTAKSIRTEERENRVRDIATAERKGDDASLFADVAHKVQGLKDLKPGQWTRPLVVMLTQSIGHLVEFRRNLARQIDDRDSYAVDQAANNVRAQVRSLINTLNPPDEIKESPDWQHLVEQLWPKTMQRNSSEFEKGTGLRGSVKKEVQVKLVRDAIEKASKQVATRDLGAKLNTNPNLQQFARLGLQQMSRMIRRKLKTLQAGKYVDENGEEIELTDEDRRERRRELQELMELFSQSALDTMKIIRSDVAPQWAPEQQPWLIAQADQQVYDILLATAEEQMLCETQAWDEIQDLRAGQAVFTLRAADKITEAAARRPQR